MTMSGGGAGGQADGGAQGGDTLFVDVVARTDERSLRQMEQQVAQAGATAGEQGGKGIKGAIGGALSSLPGLAIAAGAAVGAALVGGLTAATNFAQQARQGVKDLTASLGVSGEEAQRLGEVAKKVFGNNWGEDLGAAQQAVANVRKEIKGLSDEDLQTVTEGSLAISQRFEEDQSKVAAAVQSLMKSTSMSATEATDFIAAGFQKGLNSSGDFLDTLNEYAPQFEKAKIGGNELFSLLETGAAKGALGTDKVADAFKEFGLTLVDVNDGSKAVYAELGLNQQDIVDKINAGTLTQAQAFQLVTDRLKGVQGQANQTRIAAAIFGGAGEDFGPGLTQIDVTKTKLSELKGSTDKVKEASNTLGSVFQTAGRQILLQLQPLGDLVLDLANEAMPTVQAAIQRLGPIVSQVVKFLVDGFRQGRETAGQFAPFFQQALAVVMPVVQSLGNVVQATFVLIRTLWENVLRPAFQAILPVVTTVFGTVGQVIKVAFDTVTDIVNAVAALFRGDFKGALDFLSTAVETAFNGLQKTLDGAVPKLLEQGKNLGIKLIEGFRSGLTGLGALLLTALADAVDRASQGAPAVMQRLFGAVSAAARNEAGQLTQQSAEARANVAAASGYQGAGPRLDSTPNLNIPEEAGKFGYAYISKLKDVFVNDPKVASDCAVIASAILHNLGIKIEGSANAGTLEKNALKAGFQPVAGDEIKPGDLIVWTSGNGKTYGAVSGKHVGVAAGYVNGKLQVIENPGSKNTQVNTIYDQQNAVAYRAPGSPFAQTAPVPKPNPAPAPDSGKPSPAPVTVPIKPEITAKDISTELSAKLAGIQARLQLKLIGPDQAIKELKALEDGAISAGRKGGENMGAYAQAATQARSAIDGLKKGSTETVDVLAALQTQYDYAGKVGLPAYVKGLQTYIAQQDKAAQSAKAGSKDQIDAMANVTRARKALEEAQGTEKLGLTAADVARFRAGAQEVVKLEKGLTTSTDVEWRRRAENRIAAFSAQGQTAQDVLALVKGADAVAAQITAKTEARDKEAGQKIEAAAKLRQTALDNVSRAVSEGRIKDADRELKEVTRLQTAQLGAANLTAEQRVRIYEGSTGKILKATYGLHAEEKRQADAAVDAWALTEEAKALTTAERDAEVLRRKAANRTTERDANLTAQREQAALLRASTDLQIAEGERAATALREQAADTASKRYKLTPDLFRYSYGEGEDGLFAALAAVTGFRVDQVSADVDKALEEAERINSGMAAMIRTAWAQALKDRQDALAEAAGLSQLIADAVGSQVDEAIARAEEFIQKGDMRAALQVLQDAGVMISDRFGVDAAQGVDRLTLKINGLADAAKRLSGEAKALANFQAENPAFDPAFTETSGTPGPRPVPRKPTDPPEQPDQARRTDRATVTPSTVTPDRGLGELNQQRRDEAAGLAQVAREMDAYRLSLKKKTIAELEDLAVTEEANGRTAQAAIVRGILKDRSEAAAQAGQVLVSAQEALRAALEETDAPYAQQIEALEKLRGQAGIDQEALEGLISKFRELQDRDLRIEATVVVAGVDTGLKALDLFKTAAQGIGTVIQGVFAELVGNSEVSAGSVVKAFGVMTLGIIRSVATSIIAIQAQIVAEQLLALAVGIGTFNPVKLAQAAAILAISAAVAGVAAGLESRLSQQAQGAAPTSTAGTTRTSSTTSSTTSSSPGNSQVSIPTSQVTVMATPEGFTILADAAKDFREGVAELRTVFRSGIRSDVRVTQEAAARGDSLAYELTRGA